MAIFAKAFNPNKLDGCDTQVTRLQLIQDKIGDKCTKLQNNYNVFWKKMCTQNKPHTQAANIMI
jgi:hypothetical protein